MNIFQFFENARRVLGMNARTLDYVERYNSFKSVRLAGNKLKTKACLEKAGILVPVGLFVVSIWEDIKEIPWDTFPGSFVIKPGNSTQGKGVLVIVGKSKKKSSTWIKYDGAPMTKHQIETHVIAIMEGAFSKGPDVAIFEERIKVHPALKPYVRRGTPDVRVIVFNSVPVMAGLRLPTLRSEGRSNIHMGGIMIGVDLAVGVTTHGYYLEKIIRFLPGTRILLSGIAIPSWDKILLTAVEVLRAVNLRFAGVDITLNPEGKPVVFEVNAWPGLAIQTANVSGLREHLERVKGLSIKDARQGVALAQALFGGDIMRQVEVISGKKVLGVFEPITIETPKGFEVVTAKLDTGAYSTSIDRALLKKLGIQKDHIYKKKIKSALGEEVRVFVELTFFLRGEKIETEASLSGRSESRYDILIGRRDLKNFFIDPARRKQKVV